MKHKRELSENREICDSDSLRFNNGSVRFSQKCFSYLCKEPFRRRRDFSASSIASMKPT